jgi:PKHD-type hydroxylase
MWLLKPYEDRTGAYALKAPGVFNDNDINYLNWYVENNLTSIEARVGSAGQGRLSEQRKSNVAWLMPTDENLRFYFEKVAYYINKANTDYFQYSLTGFHSMQYTIYPETVQGKYDWHTDQGDLFTTQNMGRKLSAVVALNDDYEGGVFETLDCDTPRSYDLKKGEMIMFPSFLMHRVTPVTKGIRRSLVIWVEGPNFR